MKQLKIVCPVLLSLGWIFFIDNAGIQGSELGSSVVVEGIVQDSGGRGIEFVRVVVTAVSEKETGNKPGKFSKTRNAVDRQTVYTNSGGGWKAVVPKCSEIVIQAFSNAYETFEKKVSYEECVANHDSLVLVLTKGLSRILWGSFEHIQLYVPPPYQKKIESFIASGELHSLKRYVDGVVESKTRKHVRKFAGYILFENNRKKESRTYFDRAGSRLWYNLMGKDQMESGRYQKALEYYQKGEATRKRAEHMLQLADIFEKQGDLVKAKLGYRLALADFETLIGVFKYRWDKRYLDAAQICIDRLEKKFGVFETPEIDRDIIEEVLKKAGKYCERLDKTKMYYFCHEHKYDRVFLINKLSKAQKKPTFFFRKYSPVKIRGTRIVDYFHYDLQFVKEVNGIVKEERKLLLENLDNKLSGMPVLSYSVFESVHGPNTLVGLGWQHLFRYKKISEEKINGAETVVLEATHKVFNKINRMSGKIWIDKQNGSVCKIEWYNPEIGNREQMRDMGLILEREPHVVFVSEFGVTRGGFRFPSRCLLVESYLDESGKDFIRVSVDIEYKNYNFFMVSSEVEVDDT